MKSMNRIAPTAGKIKKQHNRTQQKHLLMDALIEGMPLTDREHIVDLCLALFDREKTGKENRSPTWQKSGSHGA